MGPPSAGAASASTKGTSKAMAKSTGGIGAVPRGAMATRNSASYQAGGVGMAPGVGAEGGASYQAGAEGASGRGAGRGEAPGLRRRWS